MVLYDFSKDEEVPERVMDADVIVTNKIRINEATVGKATRLKLVCVTATGTDNLDKDFLDSRGIGWRNVAGYSTHSVAQVTFSLLFYLLTKTRYYDDYVKSEQYVGDEIFTHFAERFFELHGKVWGIIGLGAIGRQVAAVATAFGCKVIYYSASGLNQNADYEQVSLERLLQSSDIVSVHAPLNDKTFNLINKEALSLMKPTAILINVGRGPIINEQDLAEALTNGTIAVAGLDVLSVEPMAADNPLRLIKDSRKLVITPHIAWASVEARTRLMGRVLDNIVNFFKD